MEFIVIIILLFIWASYSGLSNRVKNLERHVDTERPTTYIHPSIGGGQAPGQISRPVVHENLSAPGVIPQRPQYQPQSFTPQSVTPEMRDWS